MFSATRSTASSPGPISTERSVGVPTTHLQRPGRHRVALAPRRPPAASRGSPAGTGWSARPRSGGSPRPARPVRRRPTTRAAARGVRRRECRRPRSRGQRRRPGPRARARTAAPVRPDQSGLLASPSRPPISTSPSAQGLPGCAGTLRTLERDGQPAVRHERLQLLREVQVDQPLLISGSDRRTRRRDHVTRGPGDRQGADLAPARPGELERGLLGVAGGRASSVSGLPSKANAPDTAGSSASTESARPRWPCRRPARAGRRCRRPAPRPQCR